jgi:ATP phosphoribosyltransferase regulatory subunit
MDSLRGQIAPGTQDLVLEEAARRRQAEQSLSELFGQWGYHEIIPPTFEYVENLLVGAGQELDRAMYRFFDRTGHTMALRADFTTQIARIAASKLTSQAAPLRCYYIGSVFRHEEPQAGHQREFTQVGVELLGAATPAADAEVIALASAALEALDLGDFQLSLGHMGLFQALAAGLPDQGRERIRQAVDRRNPAELASALEAAGVEGEQEILLSRLPELVGGPELLQKIQTFGGEVASVARALEQLYQWLEAYGVASRVVLDLGEVRGMAYYTGISFRGLVPGLGWPVLSGGRYDELVGQFGRPMPAVGFGLGLERALLAQRQPAPTLAPDLLVQGCGHPACMDLVRQLRETGCRVEVDVWGYKGPALLAQARKRGAIHTLQCRGDAVTWLLDDKERVVRTETLVKEVAQWSR